MEVLEVLEVLKSFAVGLQLRLLMGRVRVVRIVRVVGVVGSVRRVRSIGSSLRRPCGSWEEPCHKEILKQ